MTLMRSIIACLAFSYVLLASCRVPEQTIAGTYYPKNGQRTRLILHEDHTFELALLNPAIDSMMVPNTNAQNFFTTGLWEYKKNKLALKSAGAAPPIPAGTVMDSITRFTSISSFNFWTRYGDPVPIRYIVISSARAKPHFGNSLYFFAQDFRETDTLKFHFDGYPPFRFPGSIAPAVGNNIHKIVLYEPYRSDAFSNLGFLVRKNKLVALTSKSRFEKNTL